MANRFYEEGLENFMEGVFDLPSDDIVASLVEAAGYTPNTAAGGHDFYDDIPGAGVLAESSPLGSKTLTGGVFDAADVTFSAVAGGDQGDYVVLWQDTTVASTSALICIFDTGTNFPISTNGGDIVVQWSNGTNKVFHLFEGLSERDRRLLGPGGVRRLKDWLMWKLGGPTKVQPWRPGAQVMVPAYGV